MGTYPIQEFQIGRKVEYCVSGMSQNYKGTGVILCEPLHVYGDVWKFHVKRCRGKIVVRTPDVITLREGKTTIWSRKQT